MATKSGGKVGACSMALSLILLMALVSAWSPRAALAEIAAEMAGEVKATMMDKTGDMTTDEANHAADSPDSAYEGAKKRVWDAYETAKDAMTEGARANYEAAKEKLSQAAGDVGAKMQERSAEL